MPTLATPGRSRRALAVLVLSLGLGTAAIAGPANAAGTVPSAPRNVTASVSGSAVTVRWAAPSSAGSSKVSHYSVGYSGGQWGNGETVAGSVRSDVFRNLADGTYSFSVAAENAAGDSKRVFVVVNVGKHKGPSFGAMIPTVVAGHQTTFMGIWKPGTKITLDRKFPGGTFHGIATILVGNDGGYMKNLTVTHNALYRTRTASGLTSNLQKVLVRSRMSLTSAVGTPGAYTLSGTVAPASKGQVVTLSYSTGNGYTAVGTVHTDATGNWTFTHTYPIANGYTFKAAAAGTTLNLGNVITKKVSAPTAP